MSRHVHFRNDGYEALGCITDYLPGLFLRIESADRHTVVFAGSRCGDRFLADRSYLGKFRVFLDLDAPSLVFGQMPVEVIDVVQGHHIDKFFQIIDREEMSADIHHEAPVAESREIIHRSGRNGRAPPCFYSYRQSLVDSLHAIENGRFALSFHRYPVF